MRVRDARQTFLGIWIRHAHLADDEILIYGDGSQRRDLTYIDNACTTFLLACLEVAELERLLEPE